MDCKIVFYAARKTSFCERALKKSFSELGISKASVSFATNGKELVPMLAESFNECELVFVIGGIRLGGERGVENVLGSALKKSELDECFKLRNPSGSDGYMLRAGEKLIIILPDEPLEIEAIMQESAVKYLLCVRR